MALTEAGERWVLHQGNINGPAFDEAHSLSRRAAEFWLRAFVAEVERRAYQKARANGWSADAATERGQALDELKRELLGDDNG